VLTTFYIVITLLSGHTTGLGLTEALVFGFLMPHRAETPNTRSQQHLARRATPALDSIQ
jgi:hypothetical protein